MRQPLPSPPLRSRASNTAAAGQISVQRVASLVQSTRRHNCDSKYPLSALWRARLFIVGGMTPLQPRDDRRADRHDRADRNADHDASQLVGADLVPHEVALLHIGQCEPCKALLFATFVECWTVEGMLTEIELRTARQR